nr:glycosyltransferase family 39 protein [Sediminivirga luteola]
MQHGTPSPASAPSPGPAARLASALVTHRRILGWLLPLAVAVAGGVMRFWRLGEPGTLVFDETYYVKDAYSLLQSGYERQWPEGSDDAFNQGDASMLRTDPGFVVHPPAGKWLIALGLQLFGHDSAFGWRFTAALVGAVSILMIGLIARRLFSSTFLGTAAAVLLAVDGSHLVHSRTSLLDIFLMFWILAGFGAVLIDRDRTGARIAALAARPGGPDGPVGFRPWLLVAGVCFGLALGTKWSGVYPLAAFGLAAVLWTLGMRRRAGARTPLRSTVRRDIVPSFFTLVPIAFVVYLSTWAGWISSRGAYNRQWAAEHSGWWDVLPDWLVSLAYHHWQAYRFHVGVESEHPYMSHPWGWIVQWRPTSFYFRRDDEGAQCAADTCAAAITSVGNPVIWWAGAAAVLLCLVAWIAHRDWRAGAILAGLAATWLPWFSYADRTIFTFYTIVMLPFVVLAVVYALGLLWGRAPADAPPGRALPAGLAARRLAVGAFLAVAVAVFFWFWPLHVAEWIPMDSWRARMWLPSWI